MVTGSSAQPRSRFWMILLAALLWGTVGITTRTLYDLSATTPISVGFFRLALATPILALLCWHTLGRAAWRIAPRAWGAMVALGLMLALYQVCFFAAIAQIRVAVATLVTLSLAPVLVAIIAPLTTGERLTMPLVWALLLALIGIGCIVGVPGSAALPGHVPLGVALAMGSACGYAVVTLIGRSLAHYHPLQTATVGFAAGSLALLPIALITGFVVAYPPVGWLLLVYLGSVPTALAYSLFLTGMQRTPATIASIITLIEPLTATLLAAVIFGERLSALGIVGAGLLLAAVALLARLQGISTAL